MPLINFGIHTILTCSTDCVISVATGKTKFVNNRPKVVSIVTLSTFDDSKLLQQLTSSFKITINWNKHQSKISAKRQKQCLDFLIDPSFQRVSRIFALQFENESDRKVHTTFKYFSPHLF